MGQSYQKFECILIDDGSSDSSYSICKEYEEKDTRMRCFTQKNHGVSYTRNKGISLARGKFIAFLDADDFIPPNYLYELVKCCEIGDVAICDTVFLDEKAVKFRFTVGKTVLTRTDAINALLIRKSINSGPAGKLYKKELIANLKFPSIKTYEDILFTLDALLNANKIVTTDRTQYFYVENNNGAMSKMIKNPSLDIIIATERLLQVIAQRKDLKPECCYVTVSHLFQYVIGLFQENNYRNSEFVDGTRKLFRKYMCLILTCRAIPWKEKLVFFLFGSGNIFAKWKKNSLDKEGMKWQKFICMLMAGVLHFLHHFDSEPFSIRYSKSLRCRFSRFSSNTCLIKLNCNVMIIFSNAIKSNSLNGSFCSETTKYISCLSNILSFLIYSI